MDYYIPPIQRWMLENWYAPPWMLGLFAILAAYVLWGYLVWWTRRDYMLIGIPATFTVLQCFGWFNWFPLWVVIVAGAIPLAFFGYRLIWGTTA